MRREVHNEYTDEVFRNKILKQEQGPVRAGEAMPPPFDWSAMPEVPSPVSPLPSAPSIFNLTTALWSALAVIALVVVGALIYNSESETIIEQPQKSIENNRPSQNTVTAQLDEKQKSVIGEPSGGIGSDAKAGKGNASLGLDPQNNTSDIFEANSSKEEPASEGLNDAMVSAAPNKQVSESHDNIVAAEMHEGTSDPVKEIVTSEPNDNMVSAEMHEGASESTEEIKSSETNEKVVVGAIAAVNSEADKSQSSTMSEGGTQDNGKDYVVEGREEAIVVDNQADIPVVGNEDLVTGDDLLGGGNDLFEGDDLSESREKVAALSLIPGREISNSMSVLNDNSDNSVMPVPGVTVTASQIQARNRFELRLFTTFNQGYRALSGNGANENIVQRINESESASVNIGVGLSFGWRINSRWTILTGISQRSTTINSQFSKQVIYDRDKEIINADDNLENSSEFEFETSAGPSVAVTRYAWRRLQEVLRNGDKLDFDFNFAREYKSVVIPLQVQYNIVNNGFKVGLIAGAQYARIYKTEVRADRPKALIRQNQMPMHRMGRDFFTRNTLEVLVPDQRLNKNIFEASFGVHLGYQLSKTVEVYLQPSYSHGLNKMYTSDNFSTVATNKQIDAGIVLSF